MVMVLALFSYLSFDEWWDWRSQTVIQQNVQLISSLLFSSLSLSLYSLLLCALLCLSSPNQFHLKLNNNNN